MMTSNTIQLLPEWTEQSGIMLTWPHVHSDWEPFIERVEKVFCQIALHTSRYERVLISCYDEAHRVHVEQQLKTCGAQLEQIRFYIVQSNDSWARDHGPITILKDGKPQLLDFEFNGWGAKFEANLDNMISNTLHRLGAFGDTPIQSIDMILEGGSIDCDGHGTLLTTSHCLLSATRNTSLQREDIEAHLIDMFGLKRVLWLEHGHLAGDDTDSHIDTLARFCSPSVIAYSSCDNPEDEHYEPLHAMEQELHQLRDFEDKPYTLVPLPIPKPIYSHDNTRLPATYANFLIINDAVLVPTYNDNNDVLALDRLTTCFPGRKVIGIDCRALIEQYGSLHCVTMQLPADILE